MARTSRLIVKLLGSGTGESFHPVTPRTTSCSLTAFVVRVALASQPPLFGEWVVAALASELSGVSGKLSN